MMRGPKPSFAQFSRITRTIPISLSMARVSPLHDVHSRADPLWLPYGPSDAPGGTVPLVGAFEELELEYAAIRKHAGVIDLPHRAVLHVSGPERVDFLNRMLTQELNGLSPGQSRRSFWLNKKGRIDADLRVVHLDDRTLLEVDTLAAARVLADLSRYIIMEDVAITDDSESTHRLAVHGPGGAVLLNAAAGGRGSVPSAPDTAASIRIAETDVLVLREDSAGEAGFELFVPVIGVSRVYEALLAAGTSDQHRARPIGWHAWNVARIEAGTPIYNIDFGAESLPAETGVLNDRVSFTKGCYLGQEIVARLHARGHPRQVVVAIRFEPGTPGDQPDGGAPLSLPASPETPVGGVSSSAISPMLGAAPIALGSVRFSHASPGTQLVAPAPGGPMRGEVQRGLRFWHPA